MQEAIKTKIEEQINSYKDKDRIKSDYNKEQETFKEYNGRQVLELLQNADDENSDEVLIKLDTDNSILEIANRGKNCTPFSIGGIKSLMLANFSPKKEDKKRKKYIGNKGLGFRSIINWSNKITIYTNNLKIEFSYDIAKKIYKEKTGEEVSKIAFLSLPKVEKYDNNEWTTKIVINYKQNYLEDIKKQLDTITNEVLLFVNNISKLTIINGKERIIERRKEDKKIYLNDECWNIFEYRGDSLLPKEYWEDKEEEEHFDLKIAVKENFEPNSRYLLYSFFPTEINIDFPFIIHGTFELDSSRNNINDSKKNRFILDKLVDFIAETSKELTKNSIDYKALEFLSHKSSNERLEKLDFYKKIDEKINELDIFPCLDKSYKRKDEVVFISDEFSEFIEKNNFNDIFPKMLISSKNSIIDLDNYEICRKIDNLSLIDEMSKKIENIDDRVELIYLVEKYFSNEEYIFEILIDANSKVISKDEEVYTPITKKYNFKIPEFINIKFMNSEFYEKLLLKFNINSNEKSRDLQRKLKSISNINSYEPAQVLQKIVTSSNKIIKETENRDEKLTIVKKMVLSLYENFKVLGDKTKIPENTQIQLLNKNREIKNSEELFLSNSYPSGKLTEYLFKNVFDKSQFLIEYEFFNFEENERFFVEFLGVNKFTKFSKIKSDYNNYDKFVFTSFNKPLSYSRLSFELNKIEFLDKIVKNISIEKFILWILKDSNIQNELNSKCHLKYIKGNGGYKKLFFTNEAPSYILYQLYNTGIFKDYLITNEELSKLINKININFKSPILKKNRIKKSDIENLILKLGAVESFEEMSIERIREILRELEIKSPDGKYTQTIYKAIRTHKEKLNDKTIKLCAKKNGNLSYYNQDEIYYAKNLKLPKKILSNIPIINIRPNLDKVIEFFGIKDINEIKIEIIKNEIKINDSLTEKFQQFLPFILVNRFENLHTKKDKEETIKNLKKSKIILCDKIQYKMDKNNYELDDYDYIKNEDNYYIKVPTDKNFDEIRRKLDFRESFSDIIGSIFDIVNVEKYEILIMDDIENIEKSIKNKFDDEVLQEVREYLNIADEFATFWRIIYKLKGKNFNAKYKKEDISKIIEELNIKINLNKFDYQNINKNCETIQKLFSELNLEISDFNDETQFIKIDLTNYHKQKLENYFHNNLDSFEKILYKWCLDNNKKEEFIDLKGKYETVEKIVENRLYLDYQKIVEEFVNNNFDFSLKDEKTKINFDGIYKNNSIKFEDEELENSERSLLYFENGDEEVEKIIERKKEKRENEKTTSIIEDDETIPKIEEENVLIENSTQFVNKNSIHNSYGTHKISIDKKKKKKGVKAETCVYNYLLNKYGKSNVELVSKDSDTLHYDIRYRDKENNWKYVEVKTFSNNMFYLSKAEKEFAEEKKENYEIFLVELSDECKNSKIKKIINYNEFKKLNFIPNDYKVYYSLKN